MWQALTNSIQHLLDRQTEQLRRIIMTSAQNVIDAVTTELTNIETPLATVLSEVNALVAGDPVNTDSLKAAADAVVAGFNAIATAAAPTTPPTS
jgi:hypothetical protein